MNMVFEHGAEYVDSAILNNFLRLLNENFTLEGEDFAKQLVEQYIKTIQKSNQADITIQMLTWVLGEFGSAIYQEDAAKLNELAEVLLTVVTNEFEDQQTRAWILCALAKLQSCTAFEMGEQVQACFEYYSRSRS